MRKHHESFPKNGNTQFYNAPVLWEGVTSKSGYPDFAE